MLNTEPRSDKRPWTPRVRVSQRDYGTRIYFMGMSPLLFLPLSLFPRRAHLHDGYTTGCETS